jgi:hypothetical protein
MSATRWLLAVFAIAVGAGTCPAQDPPVTTHVDGVDVRLEAKDGRTQFTLGAPIALELVFSGRVSGLDLNTTNYGDLSEEVHITPAEGWFRSRTASGHDYLTTAPLTDDPIRIPVLLNQGIVFLKPGRYGVSVTTGRVIGVNAGLGPIRLTTNQLSIEITAQDQEQEAALVRSLSEQIATSTGPACEQAARQLAYLPGDDAVRAKVRWLLEPQNGLGQTVESQMMEGLASSRNLKLQLDLLEAAWLDPQRTPGSSLLEAMQQTRAFLRHQTLPGWSMVVVAKTDEAPATAEQERRADISKIIATLPQRTGENRRDTAYFLMEFNGLSDGEKAQVRPAVLADFGQMEPVAQSMLLETHWKDIRDVSLVPDLEAMLDRPADDSFSHRDALQRLIDLSPETAKPYALREICDPRSDVMLEQLADLPEETLPQVDKCLETQLSASTGRHNHYWQWKAMIAARFGSENMLPVMQRIYADRKDWNPQLDVGAFLAYFLRYAPQDVLPSLGELGVNSFGVFFHIDKVFEARKAVFPDPLENWLHDKLAKGNVDEAGLAAYQLSRFGRPEDKSLVEARLQQLRQQWRERGAGIDGAPMATPEAGARKLEVDLMSTLASPEGKVWSMTREEVVRLGEGCLSSECKRYAPATP